MFIKVLLLIVFFAVMIGIGFYCRKHSTDVNGFVLGGRSVGPWLTAFAYGTSYFLGGYLRRLRRTVRLEIRHRIHLGRHRQRADRLPSCLGHPRQTHQDHDTAPGFRHHAAVF